MPNVLITGANRGIGLEFARQYAADGWTVHATCRDPDRADALRAIGGVHVHQLDVADIAAVRDLAAAVDTPLDIVIANAGMMEKSSEGRAQMFGSLDYDHWRQVLQVNLFGAVATAEAFVPHLKRGDQKKLACITSRMGSIADSSTDYIGYRTSKAALNMALQASAKRLAGDGIAVGALHPGWVATDMGGPNAEITAAESVTGLREVIARLSPKDQAQFLSFRGENIPW